MTDAPTPTPENSADPTLAIAERQLELLGELAEIAMVVSRAFGSSAVAAAETEKMILSEDWFTPEVGRARACGAKEAAESFQKASRAMRLTCKLQMAVAEIARDIRAGTVRPAKDAGEASALLNSLLRRPRPAGARSEARDRDRDREPVEADAERLVEFERLEVTDLHAAVAAIRADLGLASASDAEPGAPGFQPSAARGADARREAGSLAGAHEAAEGDSRPPRGIPPPRWRLDAEPRPPHRGEGRMAAYSSA